MANITTDVTTIAANDIYNNSVNVSGGLTGYTTVPSTPAITWTNMIGVATNTAYNAANRIRTGAVATPDSGSLAGVYIYTIGLGTAAFPADLGFLKDIANDLAAPNYLSSQKSGLFVDAPTIADLNPAFQRVASEILRLSR